MRIGVLSDIHDNLWNLSGALAALKDADVLVCCGDLCSPFVIPQLAKFPRDVHIVFGNNDADLYRISNNSAKHSNIHLHGEIYIASFDGRRFVMNHYDTIARHFAGSGHFDVVCFGHNHEREISRSGACLLINPGPIMGAKFSQGWQDVAPSFAVYDTQTEAATAFELNEAKQAIAVSGPA
jgi:uncharacterized protein